MKILQVSWDNTGGIWEVIVKISEELEKHNHQVCYYTFLYSSSKSQVKVKLIDKILGYFKYIDYIKKNEFDVIHNHANLTIDIINYFFFSGKKISHDHGGRAEKYVKSNTLNIFLYLKRIISKLIYKKIVRIAVSRYIQELEFKYENINKKQSFLLLNPIGFENLPDDCYYVEKKGEKIVIGYLGQIENNKGVSALIDLAKYVKKKNIQIKIIIAGVGRQSHKIFNEIQKNRLYNVITFINKYYRKSVFFKKVDIFISLSEFESFGLTIHEALYCKKPVITLQRDSFEKFLWDGIFVLSVPTPHEIINTIYKIKNDYFLIQMKLEDIKKEIIENYSSVEYYKKLIKIYRS